jgi:hypothetical protein
VEPIPPIREEPNVETPRKSIRQNKVEVNLGGVLRKNTITLEGETSPVANKNSQKSNRSGTRNNETTIQIEDEPAEDLDTNKIVISSSNVITFNQDDDEPSIASADMDESQEAEKSEAEVEEAE